MPLLGILAVLAAVVVGLAAVAAAPARAGGRDRMRPLAELRCRRCDRVSPHRVRPDGTPLDTVRCPGCGLVVHR
jgi:hypothetical protein